MNIRTAHFVPMIRSNTYRVELWTGEQDIKEIVTLPHDYDALEVLSDMLEAKHQDIKPLDVTFALWTDEDKKDGEIPAWNARSITARLS